MPNSMFPLSKTYRQAERGLSRMNYNAGSAAAAVQQANQPPLTNAASITPASSSAVESGRVLSATGPKGLKTLAVSIGAVSGWVMVFDAATVPADGAVVPKFTAPVKSDGTSGYATFDWTEAPLGCTTGIAVCFSTTGPTTKTASATAYFTAQVVS